MANKGSARGARLAAGAALALCIVHASSAADPAAGRTKAETCVVCHGADGIATMPAVPNLAGQPADYVVDQLRQFRSGRRPSEVMSVIAKSLSDADAADLAAWYASIRVEAKPPAR